MPTLVLLRHGQSTWNAENRFTGWTDVDLTPLGEEEARSAGRLMADQGDLDLGIVHTSVQTRSIRTAEITLAALGRSWLPVRRHWRLNERHYGALQGLDKKETTRQYGTELVKAWRRGYLTPPPPLDPDDERHARFDPRYDGVPPELLPATECLGDVVARLLPYFYDAIVPDLLTHPAVLVVAHGNSLRAMVKHLEGISDDDISGLDIPTGVPRLYDLDKFMVTRSARYLGDAEAIAAAQRSVAGQAG
ncbi:MAG: 2,3-diphosphoglycerate-dependent phosphoglycerate mutase [Acidimicrobiales bacterium]